MNKFSQSWKSLPWKKFQRKTFNIQKRIYKAIQAGDIRRAKMLQKLIIRSRAARFLAVRQIIQLNNGRKTAGVDLLKCPDDCVSLGHGEVSNRQN